MSFDQWFPVIVFGGAGLLPVLLFAGSAIHNWALHSAPSVNINALPEQQRYNRQRAFAAGALFRFRLTFHHSSTGFFRFDEQSIPVEVEEGVDLILTARDADTLAKARRFHIEGRGFPSEEAARSMGERLRLRLRVLNSLLGLGIVVPTVDSRRTTVAEGIKEKVLGEAGGVIIDTVEGLAVISDDPNHVEQVSAGRVSVYPSDPSYVLKALALMWPVEMHLDERADDALQILNVAITELSPRAKFLATYLALERMVDRLPRSEGARRLIEELQEQVQGSALDERDKASLVSSLGTLRDKSFRTSLFASVERITPPFTIEGMPGRTFLSECVDIRNTIAHNAMLDASVDLNKASTGLRNFVMSLIWTRNRIPDVLVNVPASTVQMDSFEMRLL
jgi:hypothetical protein